MNRLLLFWDIGGEKNFIKIGQRAAESPIAKPKGRPGWERRPKGTPGRRERHGLGRNRILKYEKGNL